MRRKQLFHRAVAAVLAAAVALGNIPSAVSAGDGAEASGGKIVDMEAETKESTSEVILEEIEESTAETAEETKARTETQEETETTSQEAFADDGGGEAEDTFSGEGTQENSGTESAESFLETAEGAENLEAAEFASARLVVLSGDSGVIVDPEHLIGSYGDIWLLQYKTVEQSMNAYLYYADNAEAVAPDTVVSMAGEENSSRTVSDTSGEENSPGIGQNTSGEESNADTGSETSSGESTADSVKTDSAKTKTDSVKTETESTQNETDSTQTDADSAQTETVIPGTAGTEQTDVVVTERDNPVEAIAENPAGALAGKIALIDTGAAAPNIVGQISLIDDVMTGNGHGDQMAAAIAEQNPGAQIFSIRAMDDNGQGTVSSVVSAIEYAIDGGAAIINLSLYAKTSLFNSVLAAEIRKAVDAGILVVGAAGNDGANVANYMPGSVDEAYIIGACDENGVRLAISNYGATVDYNVAADSTSEAAAKFTGWISKNGTADIPKSGELIFETDYVPEPYLKENPINGNRLLTYIINAVGIDAVLESAETVREAYGLTQEDLEFLKEQLQEHPYFEGIYDEEYLADKEANDALGKILDESYEPLDADRLEGAFFKGKTERSGSVENGASVTGTQGQEAEILITEGRMAELLEGRTLKAYKGTTDIQEGDILSYSWNILENREIEIVFSGENGELRCLITPDGGDLFLTAAYEGSLYSTNGEWNTRYGEQYYTDWMDIDDDIYLNWLKKHIDDDYYLGTPYGEESGTHSAAYPNGDPSPSGAKGMNCTAFVWHVLWKSMQLTDQDRGESTGRTPGTYGVGPTRESTYKGWNSKPRVQGYNNKDIGVYRMAFKTKADMFKYGDLKFGDIIWVMAKGEDTTGTYGADNHILIYVGDGKTDKAWHSTHSGNSWCDGTNDGHSGGHWIKAGGNCITEIVSKQDLVYGYIVYKGSPGSVEAGLSFKKIIGSAGTFSGNTKNIRIDTEFTVYSDEACTKVVEKKAVKGANYQTSVKVNFADLPAADKGTTYYLKETARCDGCAIHDATYRFKVYPGKVTKELYRLDTKKTVSSVKNVPFYFTGVLLEKKGKNQNGDILGPVKGAIYRVWYTEKEDDKRNPDWTWYFETDENGQFSYDEAHLTKHDYWGPKSSEFHFELATGTWALPYGYVHAQEVKSPADYTKDPETYTKQLKATETTTANFTQDHIELVLQYSMKSFDLKDTPGYLKIEKVIDPAYTGLLKYQTYSAAAKVTVGVYASADCSGDPVATVSTSAAAGASEASETISLPAAADTGTTYYLKELETDPCAVKDETVYPVTVTQGNTAEKPVVVRFTNKLGTTSGSIFKYDLELGESTPLGGVQFQISYYDTYSTYVNSYGGTGYAVDENNPAASWILQSGEDGMVILDAAHYVSGSEIPALSDGTAAMPFGVYRIKETKAKDGYKLGAEAFTRVCLPGENTWSEVLKIGNAPDGGSVKIHKTPTGSFTALIDLNGKTNPLYSMAGAVYQVYDAATREAVAGAVLTTNAQGYSDPVSLKPGSYFAKEISAPKNYKLDSTEWNFTVEGSQELTVEVTDEPVANAGEMTIQKVSAYAADTGTANPQDPSRFDGAEFTLSYWAEETSGNSVPARAADLTWTYRTVGGGILNLADSGCLTGGSFLLTDNGKGVFPVGTYQLEETKAPEGFEKVQSGEIVLVGHSVYTSEMQKNGETSARFAWEGSEETELRADGVTILKEKEVLRDIAVNKTDKETGKAAAQGDGSLAGIHFSVTNVSGKSVYVQGKEYADGAVIPAAELVTDEAGYASTQGRNSGYGLLPVGIYSITETATNASYLLTDGTVRNITITADTPKETPAAPAEAAGNRVKRMGIRFQKTDGEQENGLPQGMRTLEGAKFAILNASKLPVQTENGQTSVNAASVSEKPDYAELRAAYDSKKDCVVTTLVTDKTGQCSTDAGALAYGTYYVIEVESSYGYCINDQFVGKVTVRGDGEVLDLGTVSGESSFVDINAVSSSEVKKVAETPRRCDLEFLKVDSDGNRRAYIPFLISAIQKNEDGTEKILEQHVLVTDENGVGSTKSASGKHSFNTNGFDKYVENGTVTEEGEKYLKEAASWGVWFGENPAAVNDEYGALYTSYYRVTELQCQANRKLSINLLQSEVLLVENDTCGYDACVRDNVDLVTFDPLVNTPIVLSSVAQEAGTGSKTLPAAVSAEAVDHVSYTNLTDSCRYRLETRFIDLDEENRTMKLLGTNDPDAKLSEDGLKVTKEFCPGEKSGLGSTSGEVSVSALMDTKALNGHTIMAVDLLYQYLDVSDKDDVDGFWILVARHPFDAEGNYSLDENQKLYIPDLITQARDSLTGDRTGTADEKDGVRDSVKYTNLTKGEKYVIVMRLVDGSTGEDLVSGQKVQAEVTAEGDGTPVSGMVEMPEYKIDTSGFSGGEMAVVIESLYRSDGNGNPSGEPLLVHDSLLDEGQTLRWPEVKTQASDVSTEAETEKDQKTVRDLVHVKGLIFDDDDHADKSAYSYTVKGKLVYQKDFTDADGVSHKAGEEVETLPGTKNEVVITSDAAGNASFTYKDGSQANGTLQITGYGKKPKNQAAGEDVSGSYVTDKAAAIAEAEVELLFEVDFRKITGGTVVVFETLYHDAAGTGSQAVAVHEDIHDKEQTVLFPKIQTTAQDLSTQDHVGTAVGKTSVVDTVHYTNLVIGREYTLKGTLMDQETNLPLTNQDGSLVTAEASFTASAEGGGDNTVRSVDTENNAVDGDYRLIFTLDSAALAGKTAVAFENLYYNGVKVCMHTEIQDAAQTVHYPGIRTRAVDQKTGDHVGSIFGLLLNLVRKFLGLGGTDGEAEKAVIVDTVELKNLVPGCTYIVSGKLYNATESRKEGQAVPLLTDGQEVTQAVTITVAQDGKSITSSGGEKTSVSSYDAAKGTLDGTVELTYHLDSSLVQGIKTVVFETLYHKDTYTKDTAPETAKEEDKVQEHSNYEDEEQSVSEVSIHTMAVDAATKDHTGTAAKSQTGTSAADTAAKNQAGTSAADTAAKNQVGTSADGAESVIHDTVELKGLLPGAEYTIKGRLVNLESTAESASYLKTDGTFTSDRAEAYTVELTFTAKETEETQSLNFPVPGTKLQGKSLTVFEELYHKDVLLAAHPSGSRDGGFDKEALKEQTVYYPNGGTTATDNATGTHTALAEKCTITDRVYFENLISGQEYRIEGQLVYKKACKDADGNSHAVGEALPGARRGVSFTAQASMTEAAYTDGSGTAKVDGVKVHENADGSLSVSGYVSMEFSVDASKLAGQSVVAFETFYHNDIPIFVHANLDDEDQTIYFPEIRTTAAIDGEKEADASTHTVIRDEVKYRGLISGQKYVLRGEVMDKETGKTTQVVVEKEFTAREAEGSEILEFTVDTTGLAGHSLVVFETLLDEKTKGTLAKHWNLSDKAQTVTIRKKAETPTATPAVTQTVTPEASQPGNSAQPVKTGDNTPIAKLAAILLMAAGISLAAALLLQDRKHRRR